PEDDVPQPPQSHGPSSMIRQEGMLTLMPRPRGLKPTFTSEDVQLIVDLKEKKHLNWNQIADFFPGRSSGSLRAQYLRNLGSKTSVWTNEMVQKLRNAMQEYENDCLRITSSKVVGSRFSPTACKEKAEEL
ncbi:putative transcriptional activator Myb, partial [Zopfia rhizophila CBS 207.26]